MTSQDNKVLEFHDPLPKVIEADPKTHPDILITTASARPVDDELRLLGYQVIWKPVRLVENGPVINAWIGKKFEPRRPAKILIGRTPYGNSEAPSVTDWLLRNIAEIQKDTRVQWIYPTFVDDTPTSMCRNKLAMEGLESGADVVVFVDNDMSPDYLLDTPEGKGKTPFLRAALDFWWEHTGPCIVAAPYCTGGPEERPLVFKWGTMRSPGEEGAYRLEGYSREEAATMRGITRASALPTGLMWVDCAAFRQMKKPWFYYEYADESCSEKVSTEDVTFTRDASFQGIPLYCNWDTWAGHWKRKLVGKPSLTSPMNIPPFFRNACLRHLDDVPCCNVTASV